MQPSSAMLFSVVSRVTSNYMFYNKSVRTIFTSLSWGTYKNYKNHLASSSASHPPSQSQQLLNLNFNRGLHGPHGLNFMDFNHVWHRDRVLEFPIKQRSLDPKSPVSDSHQIETKPDSTSLRPITEHFQMLRDTIKARGRTASQQRVFA